MHNRQAFVKTIITSSKLSVSMDESANLLKIYSPATFWVEVTIVFAVLLFSCILIVDNTTPIADDLLFVLVATLGLMFLFAFSLVKRSYLSVFDLTKVVLFHHKGGIYSSSLDEGDQEIKLTDISRVGIEKFPRRYGDTFQIFLVIRTSTSLEVTGRGISFADAQLCAETIREFLNIKEKIETRG